MDAQFEEKTYETQLLMELAQSGRHLFTPGQVLEGIVGFDMALRTSNRELWNLFPRMYRRSRAGSRLIPKGVDLRKMAWRRLGVRIQRLPKFKYNCFIQAKRPDRMISANAKEYNYWGSPYFRYDTFPSQQKALESLALRTSGRALVTYACPAFHEYSELINAYSSGQIVNQSNFCKVAKLKGHGRYSFVSSGNGGWAHSDPTWIESESFDQALAELRRQDSHRSNSAFLASTAEDIVSVAENLGDLQETFAFLTATTFQDANNQLARSLATIYAFQFVCNVQLLIGHEG